jgi:serine protease Do
MKRPPQNSWINDSMHRLKQFVLSFFLLTILLNNSALGQTREEKVRQDKQKIEAAGYWLYNDIPKAFAEAKTSGKPIVVVLRCLPCEECVKLDDELIDADERIKPLLEKFVRVRVIHTNGLDLKLFQFDTDQSFAVFFLNADGTIYGRFGTRSHRTEWLGDVSVDGLAKAMQGALALHKDYPKIKASLQAKRGPTPEFDRPELYAGYKAKYKSTIDYQGKVVQSCIHCHQIGDAVREIAVKSKEKLTDSLLFPFPHPKIVGLTFDPKESATILKVEADSPAGMAGFKAGDQISKLAGQPLLSIADVQWVLHTSAPQGVKITADIIRSGKPMQLDLHLESGWRTKDDIDWRASTWQFRRVALGGMKLDPLPEEDYAKAKVPSGSKPMLIQHVGQFAPHDYAKRAGLVKGDILLSFNGQKDFERETDLIVYSLRNLKSGVKVPIEILRNGKKQTVSLTMP